jgi:hypothetical protein
VVTKCNSARTVTPSLEEMSHWQLTGLHAVVTLSHSVLELSVGMYSIDVCCNRRYGLEHKIAQKLPRLLCKYVLTVVCMWNELTRVL